MFALFALLVLLTLWVVILLFALLALLALLTLFPLFTILFVICIVTFSKSDGVLMLFVETTLLFKDSFTFTLLISLSFNALKVNDDEVILEVGVFFSFKLLFALLLLDTWVVTPFVNIA